MNYLLIDTFNIIWQSYKANAYNWMKNSDGKPSGHIYGAIAKIYSTLVKIPDPVTLIFAWDLYPKETYRLFPEYKGSRDRSIEAKREKNNIIAEFALFLSCLPCQIAYSDDMEADDVINTLTQKYYTKDNIFIISMDRDFWVLQPKATIFIEKGEELTLQRVQKRFGISKPEYLPLWKSVFGDISDNIPGVKGLFKKEVLPLIEKADGKLKPFLKLVKKAKPVMKTPKGKERMQKILDSDIKNLLKVVTLSNVPISVHENKGNLETLLNIVHSYDIVRMDNKLKYLFLREVSHGKK